jgi:amino acid transporter
LTEPNFLRVLGRRDALALAFGAVIGWSWVLLTGRWVLSGGAGGAMLAFVVGGVAMILIGLVYAELVSAMPEAGGEHVYSLRALGQPGSFICTWGLLLAYVTVVAFEAVALGTALDYLVPQLRGPALWSVAGQDVYLGWTLIGIGVAVLMIIVNVLGVRPSAVLQTSVTAVIIASGIFFISGTVTGGSADHLVPWFGNEATGWLTVLIMVPTIYVGFDVIPQAAEEIDLPPRDIGVMIVLSVVTAMAFYVLIILGVALTYPRAELVALRLPTADAASAAWGGAWAGAIMVLGGIAGILTSWNAFLVGASRVLWALAQHGTVPVIFARIHPRFRTPHLAVIAIGASACISPLFGRQILVWLIDAGSFALIIAYGLVVVSFLVLRRREPQLPRPFRAGHGDAIGWIALLLTLGISLVYLPGSPAALLWPWEWAICLGWTVLGVAFYGRTTAGDHARRSRMLSNRS